MIGPTGIPGKREWWRGWTHIVSGPTPYMRELKLHVPNNADPDGRHIIVNYDTRRPVGKLVDLVITLLNEKTAPEPGFPQPFLVQLKYRQSSWKFWQPRYINIVVSKLGGQNPTYELYDPQLVHHQNIGKAGFTQLFYRGQPVPLKIEAPHDN